jgi:membrane peptidoglycan carboxypeptidase
MTSTPARWGRVAAAVLLCGVLLAGVLLIPVSGLARLATSPLPTVTATPGTDLVRAPSATTITDAAGEPVAHLYDQYRFPATPEDISDAMKAAVVAIEDRRFFQHAGVDWQGVGRALLANTIVNGNPLDGQGASTITMQYVKNHRLYTLAGSEREREAAVAETLERKLTDVAIALELEDELSKQQILTRYLNVAYFGHGAYGIAAAADTYFGTSSAELSVPQAALLAGLLRAPSSYDPVAEPAAARARRDVVIAAMAATGAITPAQADAARAADLGVSDPVGGPAPGCAAADEDTAFFCRYTVSYLHRLGLPLGELRRGGYTVRTTLDREVTAAAAAAVAQQVPVEATKGIVNAMAVVAPGRDAHPVLALVANKDLGTDRAAGETAYPVPSAPVPHGAGSVYKIFTAAAALAAGLGIDSTVPAPDSYTSEVFGDDGQPYTVTNPGEFPDELTLQRALALSPNTTFVALLDRLGSVDSVVETARRLGLRESLQVRDGQGRTVAEAVTSEERASFTLGPTPTSPLELANVAATLMSGGVWCPPRPVVSVTDRAGAPVPLADPPCEQAVPPGLADTLAAGLSDDHRYGTAADAAADAGWERPMIGKTGTTQRSVSGAFLGATPQYAGAVMTWSDTVPPRPICRADGPPTLCDEGNLSGGSVPADTWFDTMVPLHEGLPVAGLPEPDPEYLRGEIG